MSGDGIILDEIRISRAGQLVDYDVQSVTPGKFIFDRDPAATKTKGGLWKPDSLRYKEMALHGTVYMTSEDDPCAWFSERDRVAIRGGVSCEPMNVAQTRLVMETDAVLCVIRPGDTLETILLAPGRVLVRMDGDITHLRGYELPDEMKKWNNIGTVVNRAADATQFEIGQRLVTKVGVSVLDDLAGIEFEGRIMFVFEEYVVAVLRG